MTSVLVRVFVFSIVFNLVVTTAGAPFAFQDILDIFGNPFKDFRQAFFPETPMNVTNSKNDSTVPNDQGKMIDVPPNRNDCKKGTYLDTSGVCRQPW
uniref:Insect cytokine uENF1 n=1 Tax=Neogurelca himachala sangaica TaxID=656750 RepID=E1CEG3_9NEOP|nr:insect cytokine precursor uENF1 [Neogurelca himachala sangaica]